MDEVEKILRRKMVWEQAAELTAPIIEKYGLTEYKTNASIGYSGSTMTPVDQHISHVTDLAAWLLSEGA